MKKTYLINSLFVVALAILFSTSVFAQEKPSTEKSKECCSSKTAKHVCTDECRTAGCDVVKAKACADAAKHVCTDECKEKGCTAVKVKLKHLAWRVF